MPKLLDFVARERRMWEQKREIRELRGEVERLRTENQRIREAMRRCLNCDYRNEAGARR